MNMEIKTKYNIEDKVIQKIYEECDTDEMIHEITEIIIDCYGIGYALTDSASIYNEDELELVSDKG